MTTEDTIIDTKQVAPPYTSFQTVKTAVGMFKEHGLPGQIDRSVLGNFSGAVQGQLLPALRFLGLISDDSHVPTAALKRLVDVSGTDGWSSELADILKAAYAPIFTLKLDTASPAQFNDKFKTSYPSVEGDTLRKSVTFFLNAVREAGIPVSAYVMKNKKPRLAPTKRRVAKDKNPNDTPATPLPPLPGHDPHTARHDHVRGKTPYDVLMNDIYDPAEMEADSAEEKAVFTLARYLKRKESDE